jgi:hypothetical protein
MHLKLAAVITATRPDQTRPDQTRPGGYIKWMHCITTHLLLNLLDFNILFGKFNG